MCNKKGFILIKRTPIVRITCLANDKQENVQQVPLQTKSFVENADSELLEKTLDGYDLLGRASIKTKKRRSRQIDINKVIHKKALEREIPYKLKVKILVESHLKPYMQFCSRNKKLHDPQKILKLLSGIEGAKIIEEKFLISSNSRIQKGRKFNIIVNKNLKLIFEVHDFREDDGKINWILRLYDDDKDKNSRSYLTPAGSFNRNVYAEERTHIICGENGKRFVMMK